MIRGLRKKWVQHIAYFLTKNNCPAKIVKKIICKSVNFLKGCGLNPIGVTTDQGSNFQKAFKEMGITTENPKIKIENDEIVIINDVPHLIKSTRNIL